MRYGQDRAQYEASLARAHRALHVSHMCATDMGDAGAADDTWALLKEIERLAEDSLKGGGKRARTRPINRT